MFVNLVQGSIINHLKYTGITRRLQCHGPRQFNRLLLLVEHMRHGR